MSLFWLVLKTFSRESKWSEIDREIQLTWNSLVHGLSL